MDLDQLRSFLAVARLRRFTLAARERGLTQPGISRQIQRIERELGATLLERNGEGLGLTEAGQRFLAFAEAAITQHDSMLAEVRGAAPELTGDLRIIASTTPGAYLVPSLVARFHERHPRVQPSVAIADSAAVVAAIADGRWDVGFTGAPVHDPALRSSVIAEDEIVLAVPSGHALAARERVALAELGNLPFLEREDGSGTRESLRAALARQGLALPPRRIVMVLSSCQALIAAVRQGLGVGFVSTLALDPSPTAEVVGVRLADVAVRRRMYLVHAQRRDLPPVAAAFVAFVEPES